MYDNCELNANGKNRAPKKKLSIDYYCIGTHVCTILYNIYNLLINSFIYYLCFIQIFNKKKMQ